MNKIKRICRCCGTNLPSKVRYGSNWCWMCWRRTWEAEHPRYYVLRKPREGESQWITYYEEVQQLRGVDILNETNQPLIQEAMKKEREMLMVEEIAKKVGKKAGNQQINKHE